MRAGPPRIKGTGLSMRLGDPAVDYWADATAVVMDWDLDYTPLECGGYSVGITDAFFDITAVQSTHPDSLWTLLFEHRDVQAPFAYAPHGNETPTPEEPHFTGILHLPGPVALGGEAGEFNEYTFTVRLPIVQGPLRVTE